MEQNGNDQPAEGASHMDRRSLVNNLGAKVAGAALIGSMVAGGIATTSTPARAQGITDADIFNFALNLEYLEAEFYLRAVTGQGLAAADTTGTGTAGAVTGGSLVPFRSTYVQQYAAKIAIDEQVHVKFIRAVLGAGAVARPAIDLEESFTTLAIAAGLIVPGQTFNPFADDVSFLLGAFVFEDVGVTAYGGAAALIDNPDFLSYAASVLAVEAYHAGAIRTLLANLGAGAAVNRITTLRALLSGADDERGLTIPGNNYNFVPNDINALAFRRSTTQVLNIVYGNPNKTPGLFFPNGMNGNIK